MAQSHRMIEPFEPGQVREANGHRIVSYGTSSYGYDIRCSNEFKIFTNINSTIVDPKKFDEGSFVDFRGDVCIIPPNSFALARTSSTSAFRATCWSRASEKVRTRDASAVTRAWRWSTARHRRSRRWRGARTAASSSGATASVENGSVIVSLLDAPRLHRQGCVAGSRARQRRGDQRNTRPRFHAARRTHAARRPRFGPGNR